jgi:putative transposase
VVDVLIGQFALSQRRACALSGIARSSVRYEPKPRPDAGVIEYINAHIADNPRHGFDLLYATVRLNGVGLGKTRLHRVYRQLGLNLPRRGKKRLPERIKTPLEIPKAPHHTLSMDFMADGLWSGRKLRTFNVIDDYNRESLKIEIDTSLPAARVVRALDEIVHARGAPKIIRMDNGPEFISNALAQWAHAHQITLQFIEPGSPTQNAYIERFNKTYRTEILDAYVFDTLDELREVTETWRTKYNTKRPHKSLGGMPPVPYRIKHFPKTLYF